MAVKFNPFTGQLQIDEKGSGGGGASYIDGEVQNFSALPQTIGSPAVDSAYLVREAEGAWLLARKPAGIYIRTANTGVRADDWTYAGAFPDVFNDANFLLYDNADSTKNLQFQLSGIAAATTRTITMPDANVTLPDQGTSTGDTPTFAKVTINDTVNDLSTLTLANDTGGNNIEFEAQELTLRHTGTNDTPYINVTDGTDYALLGVRQGDMFLQGSNAVVRIEQSGGVLADIKVNKLVLEDATSSGEPTATFDADGNLTDNRTYDLPDSSGTIALTSDIPAAFNPAAPGAIGGTTPSTGAFTTLSAAPTSGSALTLTGGTVTASAPLIDATQTWNASGTTFTGVRFNIINAQSATASIPLDFQIGGSPVLQIRRDGTLRVGSTDVGVGGGYAIGSNNGGFTVRASNGCGWNMSGSTITTEICTLIEQRHGTNAQEYRLFGTFTSSTNYQRMTVKSVKQTLSALSGASATTTGTFIPDGAVVVGVTTRVGTLLTGATGYTIGDGTDADRWGDITGTAVGTTSDNRDWTAGTVECFTAGGNITLTAKTSNFTAGAVEICVFYIAGEAD